MATAKLFNILFALLFIMASQSAASAGDGTPLINRKVTPDALEMLREMSNHAEEIEREKEATELAERKKREAGLRNTTPLPTSGDDFKQIKNELAKCSGNFFLWNASIKSNIVSLGSAKNNEGAIEFNFLASTFFRKIGSTINGDDFELMSESYFDSKISKFNSQKSSLGATQAKQNIMNEMREKSTFCFQLITEPKIASYAIAVLGEDQVNLFGKYLSAQGYERTKSIQKNMNGYFDKQSCQGEINRMRDIYIIILRKIPAMPPLAQLSKGIVTALSDAERSRDEGNYDQCVTEMQRQIKIVEGYAR